MRYCATCGRPDYEATPVCPGCDTPYPHLTEASPPLPPTPPDLENVPGPPAELGPSTQPDSFYGYGSPESGPPFERSPFTEPGWSGEPGLSDDSGPFAEPDWSSEPGLSYDSGPFSDPGPSADPGSAAEPGPTYGPDPAYDSGSPSLDEVPWPPPPADPAGAPLLADQPVPWPPPPEYEPEYDEPPSWQGAPSPRQDWPPSPRRRGEEPPTASIDTLLHPSAGVRPRRKHPIRLVLSVLIVLIAVVATGGLVLAERGSQAKPKPTAAIPVPSLPVLPTHPASSAPRSGPVRVHVAPGVPRSAATTQIVSLLGTYFTAINQRDYTAYAALFTPRGKQGLSPSQFSTGFRTTEDSAATLTSVSTSSGGTQARVTFDSHQAPSDSINHHEACTTWHITMYLIPSGAHSYLIDKPPSHYTPTYQACG